MSWGRGLRVGGADVPLLCCGQPQARCASGGSRRSRSGSSLRALRRIPGRARLLSRARPLALGTGGARETVDLRALLEHRELANLGVYRRGMEPFVDGVMLGADPNPAGRDLLHTITWSWPWTILSVTGRQVVVRTRRSTPWAGLGIGSLWSRLRRHGGQSQSCTEGRNSACRHLHDAGLSLAPGARPESGP